MSAKRKEPSRHDPLDRRMVRAIVKALLEKHMPYDTVKDVLREARDELSHNTDFAGPMGPAADNEAESYVEWATDVLANS